MTIGRLGKVRDHVAGIATMLENTLVRALPGELTEAERAVIQLRMEQAKELRHALARDVWAMRERLRQEACGEKSPSVE